MRYELTEYEWTAIKPMLPNKPRGMPIWAQWIGECLPLTHYLRIVRSIMLKGSSISDLHYDAAVLFGLMLIAMTIAVMRFRRTLD
jgi:ABC-2 type transport system permease protein